MKIESERRGRYPETELTEKGAQTSVPRIERNPDSEFRMEEINEILRQLLQLIFSGVPEIEQFRVGNIEYETSSSSFDIYALVADAKCRFQKKTFHVRRIRVDITGSEGTIDLATLDTDQYDFSEEFDLSGSDMMKIENQFERVLESRIRDRISELNKLVRSKK